MLIFAASIKARVMLLVDIYSKVSENIRLEKAGSKNWWTLVKSLT
jgi:hypothetical protein